MKKKKRHTLDSVGSIEMIVNQDSGCYLKISSQHLVAIATDWEGILYNIS